MQRALNVIAVFICVFISIGICIGCAQQSNGSAGLAARYTGGQITEQEVTDYTAAYRHMMSYDDDATWLQFLNGEGLDSKTWREQVIATLVDKQLIKQKANELGIVPDESSMEKQAASDREASGAKNDDEWTRFLEANGTNPDQYRENLEFTSIEQQLLLQELSLDPVEDASILNAYIDKNLVSRVARRYSALEFSSEQAAEQAIAPLSGLEGEALAQAFESLLAQDNATEASQADKGDIGWDIAGDFGSIQNELNEEMLGVGELSSRVHASGDKYYVLLCTDRFDFDAGTTFDGLPEGLKTYVVQATTYANWASLVDEYLAQLRTDAQVMVSAMPSGLPYDVGSTAMESGVSEQSKETRNSEAKGDAGAASASTASNSTGKDKGGIA